MNPNQATTPDESNVIELSDSPGRRLRVLRQSRGLEVERIAAQLHLRTAAVEALEQDRYDQLPGAVFVAGYLRNYARLLGVDPAPLIAAYRTAHPSPEPPPPRVGPLPRREIGSGHIVMRILSLAILAGAIGMLVLWLQNRADLIADLFPTEGGDGLALTPDAGVMSDSRSDPDADSEIGSETGSESGSASGAPAPAPSANALAIGAPPAAPLPLDGLPLATPPEDRADTALALPPGSDLAIPPPAGSAQRALEPDASAGESAPPPAAGTAATGTAAETDRQVALSFSGASWIDVRDASGRSVLSGEMRKGDRRVLSGDPPYAFVIGNAASAAITVGGKPFDLGGVSRGGVARFKLDPDGAQ